MTRKIFKDADQADLSTLSLESIFPEIGKILPPGRERTLPLLREMVMALRAEIKERGPSEGSSGACADSPAPAAPAAVRSAEAYSAVYRPGGLPQGGTITPAPVPDLPWQVMELKREVGQLRTEMAELKREIQELKASRPEQAQVVPADTISADDVPAVESATVSCLETAQIGILPENITEEAWPLLRRNLEKAGVPVPEVVTWVSRETLSHLVDTFTKHCNRVHL